jgi:hypothetical protein
MTKCNYSIILVFEFFNSLNVCLVVRFYPIDRSVEKNKQYEKLLWSTSKFGAEKYGTRHFREEPAENELPKGVKLEYLLLISINIIIIFKLCLCRDLGASYHRYQNLKN